MTLIAAILVGLQIGAFWGSLSAREDWPLWVGLAGTFAGAIPAVYLVVRAMS